MPPDLLGQMSSAARDDVLQDPRWEGFARGDLSDGDREDLLARARAAGVDEETIEALGPRDPSFDDRLAEAALAAIAKPSKVRAPATDATVGDATKAAATKAGATASDATKAAATKAAATKVGATANDATKAAATKAAATKVGATVHDATKAAATKVAATASDAPANDTTLARKGAAPSAKGVRSLFRPSVMGGVAFTLAAAAAVALLVKRPSNLPVFEMTIEGGTSDSRSDPGDKGGVVKVAPGNRLVISLRPEGAAGRQLDARGYLYGPGEPTPWPGAIAVADTGAVRMKAAAHEVFEGAPAGRYKLCVSVGDAGSLPTAAGSEPAAARASGFVTVCRDLEWAGAAKSP